MGSGRRALHHATDTGRASSHAGAGKVEVEPPTLGPDHGFNVRAGPRLCQASYLFGLVKRPSPVRTGLVILSCLLPRSAPAQGLPPYAPINPVADSRTSLGFEPYRLPQPGRWSLGLALD